MHMSTRSAAGPDELDCRHAPVGLAGWSGAPSTMSAGGPQGPKTALDFRRGAPAQPDGWPRHDNVLDGRAVALAEVTHQTCTRPDGVSES